MISLDKEGDSISLSSCLSREVRSLPPHPAIQFSPLAYQVIFENPVNPNTGAVMDLPPAGVYSICLNEMSLYVELDPFEHLQSTPVIISDCSFSRQMSAANTLLSLLEQSVERRVASIASLSSNNTLCVMFSGGIDCSILVCILCRVLQARSSSCVIELANISFGTQVETVESQSLRQLETLFPDRYTACTDCCSFLFSTIVCGDQTALSSPAVSVRRAQCVER